MSAADRETCAKLAAQLWTHIPSLRVVASSRVRAQHGLPAGQKGVIVPLAHGAPKVLATAGSWSKLVDVLRSMGEE